MRVSQRLDYAVRTLALLAAQPEGAFVAAGDLADRLALPRRFVEQQVTELARAGIVACRRGATGGSALARPASEITAYDVVVALEGDVIDIPHQSGSAVAELWQGMAGAAEDYLRGVTIADLVRRQREMDQAAESMYFI